MKITGVLLSAGSSRRMGDTNKLLLEYKNHTIFDEALIQLINSKLDELIVVIGFESDKIHNILEQYDSENIISLYNENYNQGRASSIKCAVDYIQEFSDAVLFMVVDKPMIQSSLINKAIDSFIEKQPDILYVQTSSGRGHPILFSEKLFSELLELEGDIIGNDLIEKYKSNTVILQDSTRQHDVDTYEDYLSLVNLEK